MNASQSKIERKLTTIMAADAAGYASAMDADEVGTLEALRAARGVFAGFIERHNGRIANTAGDGLIAEFPSVVEAVQCAIEVQRELGHNGQGGNLRFRIGIHLGDVILDGDDLLGEGVNLAARLQTMAEPGGVLVSQQVYDQVHSKLTVGFEYLGERRPKNYSEDVPVYCVSFGDEKPQPASIFGRNASKAPPPAENTRRERREPAEGTAELTDDEGLRQRVVRHAMILGVVWIGLVVINLVTSADYFWARWPRPCHAGGHRHGSRAASGWQPRQRPHHPLWRDHRNAAADQSLYMVRHAVGDLAHRRHHHCRDNQTHQRKGMRRARFAPRRPYFLVAALHFPCAHHCPVFMHFSQFA